MQFLKMGLRYLVMLLVCWLLANKDLQRSMRAELGYEELTYENCHVPERSAGKGHFSMRKVNTL